MSGISHNRDVEHNREENEGSAKNVLVEFVGIFATFVANNPYGNGLPVAILQKQAVLVQWSYAINRNSIFLELNFIGNTFAIFWYRKTIFCESCKIPSTWAFTDETLLKL